MRPFLKWLGGKYRILPAIEKVLPQGDTLIEPFVGAGSVFLNLDYKKYIVNDINKNLIDLFKIVKKDHLNFIKKSKKLFNDKYNNNDSYYKLREEFNNTTDKFTKAVIFLYLNRHGYNGLTRFNKQGKYNVPFGSYEKTYYPEDEIKYFANRAKRVRFVCKDFSQVINEAKEGSVIYCDPPYVPLSHSAKFTEYSSGDGFSLDQQRLLADLASATSEKGIPVLISNNNTPITRELYKEAILKTVMAQRNVSCNGQSRKKYKEILALFE